MAEPSANLPRSFPLSVLVEEATLRRMVSTHIVNMEVRMLINDQLSTLFQDYAKAFRELDGNNANLKDKVAELQKENAFLQAKLGPQPVEINTTQSEKPIPKARGIIRRSMPVTKTSMSPPPPSKYDPSVTQGPARHPSVPPTFKRADSYGVHEHDILTNDILNMLSPVSSPSRTVSPMPVQTRLPSINDYFGELEVENDAILPAELHQDCKGLERNGSGASNVTISSTASSDYSNTTSASTATSDMSESERTLNTKHLSSVQADSQTSNDSPKGLGQFRASLDEPCAPTILKNPGSAHVPRPHSGLFSSVNEDNRRISLPYASRMINDRDNASQPRSDAGEFGKLVVYPFYNMNVSDSSSSASTRRTEFGGGASILLSDGVMAGDHRFRRTETLQYGGENSLWSAMVNPASDEDTRIKIITAFLRSGGHPNIAKPAPNQGVLLYGYGLLHIAITTRAVKFLEFLLQAGANPDAISLCTMDDDKMSPIFLAAKINFVDGIRLLVKYGGSIKNALGHSVRKKTAFIGAAETGAADALRLLIQCSGTVGWTNVPDAMGMQTESYNMKIHPILYHVYPVSLTLYSIVTCRCQCSSLGLLVQPNRMRSDLNHRGQCHA